MAKEKDKNTVFWGLGFISGTFKTIKQYSFKKVNDLKVGDKKESREVIEIYREK